MIGVTTPTDLSTFALSSNVVAKTDASTIVVPAGMMAVVLGTPAIGLVNRTAVWLLDAVSVEDVGSTVDLPAFWQTCHVDALWTNAGIGAGNIACRFDFSAIVDGGTVPDPTTGAQINAVAGAQNIVVRTRMASDITVPTQSIAFEFVRLGTDSGDTLANDAGLICLEFTRAS